MMLSFNTLLTGTGNDTLRAEFWMMQCGGK